MKELLALPAFRVKLSPRFASTEGVRAPPESEVFGIRGMIPEGRRDENFRL